jgi:hypothetical protein
MTRATEQCQHCSFGICGVQPVQIAHLLYGRSHGRSGRQESNSGLEHLDQWTPLAAQSTSVVRFSVFVDYAAEHICGPRRGVSPDAGLDSRRRAYAAMLGSFGQEVVLKYCQDVESAHAALVSMQLQARAVSAHSTCCQLTALS